MIWCLRPGDTRSDLMRAWMILLIPTAFLLSGCGTASLVGAVVDTAAGVAGTAVDIVTSPIR
jgi:hypothetical protein